MSASEFSEGEKRLISGLAKVLHEWLREFQDVAPNAAGYKWHSFMSDFSTPMVVLWRLGLAHAAFPSVSIYDVSYENYVRNRHLYEGLRSACFHESDHDQIDSDIRFDHLLPEFSLERILLVFKALVGSREIAPYYSGLMSNKDDETFKILAPDFEPAVKVLLEFGYLDRDDDQYWWTEKMPVNTY